MPDEQRWAKAYELTAGEDLLTAAGLELKVAGVRAWTEKAQVFNLTVEGVHTYYVLASGTPVLVHNCNRSGDVHLDLNHKDGWDTEQIAAADAKVAHLDGLAEQGQLVKL